MIDCRTIAALPSLPQPLTIAEDLWIIEMVPSFHVYRGEPVLQSMAGLRAYNPLHETVVENLEIRYAAKPSFTQA